jgi:hypothetical protein
MPNLFRKKTDERVAWHALKTKHAAVLKTSKLRFTDKLGPALDKLAKLEPKDSKDEAQKQANVLASAKQAKVVKDIAEGYLVNITGLGNPAERELRKELEKIHRDASFYDFLKV